MLSTLEKFALTMYPNGQIDGITYEDYFGEIVWITTSDKSTHSVSTRMMLEYEGKRHSKVMKGIRNEIANATRSLS